MKHIAVILAITAFVGIYLSTSNPLVEEKINGASLVSPRRPVDGEKFKELADLNTTWVSIIPYGFTRKDEARVYFNHERQWWGERVDGTQALITKAKRNNFKIMLKPHVWIQGQGWIGDFELGNETEWSKWEEDFENYILVFAKIADSLDVEIFCIGTEFRKSVQYRNEFWTQLIGNVRNVYKGKLTYAANWDNYENVRFWNRLDFIGVDAYFPITDKSDPTVDDLEREWSENFKKLRDFSKITGKPVIFTEFGYQSVLNTAGNHWEVDRTALSMTAQANAYDALFRVFWDEPWFAGGFFWKWHLREGVGGPEDPNFTPQGKPALEVIRWHYGIH